MTVLLTVGLAVKFKSLQSLQLVQVLSVKHADVEDLEVRKEVGLFTLEEVDKVLVRNYAHH